MGPLGLRRKRETYIMLIARFLMRKFIKIICQFEIFSIFPSTKMSLNYLTYIEYLNFIKIPII